MPSSKGKSVVPLLKYPQDLEGFVAGKTGRTLNSVTLPKQLETPLTKTFFTRSPISILLWGYSGVFTLIKSPAFLLSVDFGGGSTFLFLRFCALTETKEKRKIRKKKIFIIG